MKFGEAEKNQFPYIVRGVVEEIVNEYAEVRLEAVIHKSTLDLVGVFRKGAWFQIMGGKIKARPDLEDNEHSRKAKEIDLSFLDETSHSTKSEKSGG
jgi:hypothetical protein